jgi:hypothetical protein
MVNSESWALGDVDLRNFEVGFFAEERLCVGSRSVAKDGTLSLFRRKRRQKMEGSHVYVHFMSLSRYKYCFGTQN